MYSFDLGRKGSCQGIASLCRMVAVAWIRQYLAAGKYEALSSSLVVLRLVCWWSMLLVPVAPATPTLGLVFVSVGLLWATHPRDRPNCGGGRLVGHRSIVSAARDCCDAAALLGGTAAAVANMKVVEVVGSDAIVDQHRRPGAAESPCSWQRYIMKARSRRRAFAEASLTAYMEMYGSSRRRACSFDVSTRSTKAD